MHLRLPGERFGGQGGEGVGDRHVHTAILKVDDRREPPVEHVELCVMGQPGWEGSLGENGYTYMYG